jgi:hypothetical protein
MSTINLSIQHKVLSHGKIKSSDKCGSDQTAKLTTLVLDGKEKLMDSKQLLNSNMTSKKPMKDFSVNQPG